MDGDHNPIKPPPLPAPDAVPTRNKPSFWRTPLGVLAAIGASLCVLMFAVVIAYGVAMNVGYVPDAAAVPGGNLPSRVVALLHDYEVVKEDESVVYYYSAGLFDHFEDGHLITAQRVVWFWRDEENNEAVEQYYLDYQQIEDIRVAWGESLLDDTIITIVDEDDDEIEIWVSTDEGGDRKYYQQLVKLWNEHR